jgi:AAA15 family ATPase/GTPase
VVEKLNFLKLVVKNHPLLTDEVSFSLVADQRVSQDDSDQLTNLYGRIWVNNVMTIVGRNATGKTTIMKLLLGTLSFLLNNRSIDQTRLAGTLFGREPITLETYFYGSDSKLYLDEVVLSPFQGSWSVESEIIRVKKAYVNDTKNKLFDFTNADVFRDRSQLDDLTKSVLAPDDSLFRTVLVQGQKKIYQAQNIFDTLFFTNVNALTYDQAQVPGTILAYLDPTIEYLKIETTDAGQSFYRLKFKNSTTEITDNNFATIELYLSSGTAKGITLYQHVLGVLKVGGIIFIDELENHFNQAIVRSFIEYFTNPRINVKRATLIFSTHYSELLDDISRGDQIYIARRENRMSLTRYSDTIARSDISKTEVFDANNLGGTSPDYDTFIALRKATREAVNGK